MAESPPRPIGQSFERLTSLVLSGCALILTIVVLRRELLPPPDPSSPVNVPDWRSYQTGHMTIGPDTAPVTILEFGDFECPFCARFYSVATQIRSRYGVNIRLRFRNLPISALHPHALAAARAADCSSHFGAFEPFHNYLFEHHDSLGVESWSAIARKAGIADTLAFEKCLDAPTTMAALTNDSLDAERLRVTGTPTILINNWRMQASPTFSAVDSLVVEVLKKSRSR